MVSTSQLIEKTRHISGPMVWYMSEDRPSGSEFTFASHKLGTTDDVVRIRITSAADPISGDITGGSTVDYVYRGGDCFVDMVLNEFSRATVQRLLAPFSFGARSWMGMGAVGNTVNVPVIGRPWNPTKSSVVLWGIALNYHGLGTGMPVDPGDFSQGYNNCILFENAIIAPDMVKSIVHGPRLKNVPLTIQALPYEAIPGEPASIAWGEDLKL